MAIYKNFHSPLTLDILSWIFHRIRVNCCAIIKRDFFQMMKGVDPEQVERIFNSCAKSSRGEISKDDLRHALEKAKQQ